MAGPEGQSGTTVGAVLTSPPAGGASYHRTDRPLLTGEGRSVRVTSSDVVGENRNMYAVTATLIASVSAAAIAAKAVAGGRSSARRTRDTIIPSHGGPSAMIAAVASTAGVPHAQ